MSSFLTSIQSLLNEFNPNSPANNQAAILYTENMNQNRMSSFLTSIQSLLNEFNPNSPANNQAAILYTEYEYKVLKIVEDGRTNAYSNS